VGEQPATLARRKLEMGRSDRAARGIEKWILKRNSHEGNRGTNAKEKGGNQASGAEGMKKNSNTTGGQPR